MKVDWEHARVAVIIPAFNETRHIAATVRSAKAIPRVDLVLVVDDGSTDNTQAVAREAGAVVVRHSQSRGKAGAIETGAAVVDMRDDPDLPPRFILTLDADLGETAVNAAPLIPPVVAGTADLAIASFPPAPGARGRDLAVKAARRGIEKLTGWTPQQPTSGIRCISRPALNAVLPLSGGWGGEVGMTIDLLHQGMVAVEIACQIKHRPAGAQLSTHLHRGVQLRDIMLAIQSRRIKLLGHRIRSRRGDDTFDEMES